MRCVRGLAAEVSQLLSLEQFLGRDGEAVGNLG
jgi:hypothetical protein